MSCILYSHFFLFRHDLMQFSGSSWPSVLLTAATIKRPNLLFSAFSNGVFIVFDLAGFTLLQNFRFDGLKFNYHIDTSFFQKRTNKGKNIGELCIILLHDFTTISPSVILTNQTPHNLCQFFLSLLLSF